MGRKVLTDVIFLMLTSIDKVVLVGHVKEKGQKVDDAKVPTHVWSFFFKESFLHYFDLIVGWRVQWKEATQTFIGDMVGSTEKGYQKVGESRWMDLDN